MAEPSIGSRLSDSKENGIDFKVQDNGRSINKTIYLYVGLKQNGLKKVLGMGSANRKVSLSG